MMKDDSDWSGTSSWNTTSTEMTSAESTSIAADSERVSAVSVPMKSPDRWEDEPMTRVTWKPFETYDGLYDADVVGLAVGDLRYNAAIRRLALTSNLINRKSQNPSFGHDYITQAEAKWCARVNMYVQRINRMRNLSRIYVGQATKDATQSDEKMSNACTAKVSKSTPLGAVRTSDSMAQALVRTRGIILPQHLPYGLRLPRWAGNARTSQKRASQTTQPLVSLDYYGEGDEEQKAKLERVFADDDHTTSLTETFSDTTDADCDNKAFDPDLAIYYCGGDDESFLDMDVLGLRPRAPTWHRYRLPGTKEGDDTFLKGSKEKRREASKFVMADLINRRKAADATERRRAEEQMRMKQERRKSPTPNTVMVLCQL